MIATDVNSIIQDYVVKTRLNSLSRSNEWFLMKNELPCMQIHIKTRIEFSFCW